MSKCPLTYGDFMIALMGKVSFENEVNSQLAHDAVLKAIQDNKPTFEEFVNALVDGRSDGVRTGVIYRSVCNELCCGVQDLVDCTENLKDSYERLYGEQPEVKPKPKISALAEEISRHYVAVSRAMREADPAAAVRESEAVLRKQFERMGLAHLIDWEDGS